ncbi:MAG TPA: PemK family transcriptional regulator [Lentisphaeria bacterium]|nr:PemK family transcriptional regulator [Lentisphaeria bacterium]
MKRGQVRWCNFPTPDRRRPVLLVARDLIINRLGEVTVVQITSTIRDISSEVFLNERDGMPKACVVNCDHLHCVSCGKIGGLVTSLSRILMRAVSAAIDFALDLSVD